MSNQRKKGLKILTILVFFCSVLSFTLSPSKSQAADQTIIHTLESDYKAGTLEATLDPNISPGDLKLKRNKHSLTETTYNDFKSGLSGHQNFQKVGITRNGDGEFSLNQGYTYNNFSNPAVTTDGNVLMDLALNPTLNLVYAGTWGSGVTVLNTQGTKTTADDVLVTRYTTTSTPAIARNTIINLVFDSTSNLLYVGNGGGLSVINTQGTVNPGDDTLVKTYNTVSTPPITANGVSSTFYDPTLGILFVGTYAGITLIDTKKTISAADDTLITHYTQTTTPAIAANSVNDLTYDAATSQLYVATYQGLSVLNLNNTISKLDDTFVFNYNQTSTPALSANDVRAVTIDYVNDLVFVSSGEIFGINRHGTPSCADDTIDVHYSTSTTPALKSQTGMRTLPYYPENHYLIVGGATFVTIIDTKGTISQSDDVLVGEYDSNTMPGLSNRYVNAALVNSNDNLLYLGELGGTGALDVIDLNKKYQPTAAYISKPFWLSSTPSETFFWDQTKTNDHGINFQFRTGDINASLIDDFNDGLTSNIIDPGWGGFFNTIEESEGTVKLKNPNSDVAYVNIKFSDIPNSIPIGSTIRMRYRSNTIDDPVSVIYGELATDDFDTWGTHIDTNSRDWQIVTYTAEQPISMVLIYLVLDNWQPTDSFEIDWITIEKPDASWDSWSSPCSNQYECVLPDTTGKQWVQYRTNLSTTNENTSPSVESVTFGAGYQDQGTYTSQIVDAGHFADWKNITADLNLPAGTIAEIKVRSGNTASPDGGWSSWENVN